MRIFREAECFFVPIFRLPLLLRLFTRVPSH